MIFEINKYNSNKVNKVNLIIEFAIDYAPISVILFILYLYFMFNNN